MFRRTCWIAAVLAVASSAAAQQQIYWKKDHLYAGPGGKEIAVATPVPADQTAPSTPASLTSSQLTSTSVRIGWTGSTDTGGSSLAGYKIYRQQGTGPSLPVGTVGTGTLSFVDEGLTPATTYTYRVRAFDNAQNHSAASASINITTSSINDTTAPAVPAGLTGYLLLPVRNSVRLTWNRSVDTGGSGVAGYRVYRGGTLISGTNPIPEPTFTDTSLAYATAYAYTVKAVDVANNTSAATSAYNITTGRELLFEDDFNRLDGALVSPWTVNLGAATNNMGEPINGSLTLSGLKLAATADYPYLTYWTVDPETQEWVPYLYIPHSIWSQTAMQPGAASFKATLDVVSNSSTAGIVFYTQSATGTDPEQTFTYASSKGYRAVLQNGSVLLQSCSDLNYFGNPSSVCSTVGSAASVPTTGTISVETNASTGSVKVYVNGTLKITATISTNLMTGGIGATSRGYYDYDNSYPPLPTTYHTATLDNFILEGN
jgi:chitodextrinase